MIKLLSESFLHLLFIFPIIILTLKNKSSETLKIVLIFTIYFIINDLLLNLPFLFPETKFSILDGKSNWSGKIYNLIGSVLFLLFYRKYPLKDYFLTFKQHPEFLKTGVIIVIFGLLVQSIISFKVLPKSFNIETLLYQFSIPGITEEIAFRGIMLGLLTKILKSKYVWVSPAILTTSILFGFAHSLFLTKNFEIFLNLTHFIKSFSHGLLWGWITIKSGSILLALLSHNLNNGISNIIRMR